LLSHDLIEGAYARAGLASDIEVIDDYPSHYSAYNRRKHRWLRGDWQILRWISNQVPNEAGQLVPNPISLVSRWKIVDNLRRSLIEPATFFLLVAGWFFLPGGPRFWTLVTVALLFLPIYFRLIFALCRAALRQSRITARNAITDFFTSHVSIFLNIAFLAHQTLVSLDAVIRTIIRSTITHSRLLEWETATEAELGINKRTPVDIYLDWMPVTGACLGLTLLLRPEAAPYALPFIVAWCCSKLISHWINRSPHAEDYEITALEHRFLREVALRTWRYFAEFSNEKNNWLIPDNLQEQAYRVDERLSPTNLGFLLNARQAALEFGYVTLSEFVALTERTLQSAVKLPRYFGHFVNWYDNITSKPLDPLFISSVDSGNLIASLLSLKQHCLELQHEPLVRKNALAGLSDHCRICSSRKDAKFDGLNHLLGLRDSPTWFPTLLLIPENTLPEHKEGNANEDFSWRAELRSRVEALREEARNFMPWQLPEFEPIRKLTARDFAMPSTPLTPANGEAFYQELDDKLRALTSKTDIAPEIPALASRLGEELPVCRSRLNSLASRLKALAMETDRMVREMNFKMLVDRRRT